MVGGWVVVFCGGWLGGGCFVVGGLWWVVCGS